MLPLPVARGGVSILGSCMLRRFVPSRWCLSVLLPLSCVPGAEDPTPVQDAGQSDAGTGGDPDAGPQSVCGDARVDVGEECDDGDTVQTNACKNDCTFNVCGDNYVLQGVEECDEGDTQNGDGCSAVCLLEPPPPPDAVTLQGKVLDPGWTNPASKPMNYVEVNAIAVVCNGAPCPSSQTDVNGTFGLSELPPQSSFFLKSGFVPKAGNEALYGPGGALAGETERTSYRTVVPAEVGAAITNEANAYMVRFSWLRQAAVDCGAFVTTAAFDAASGGKATYFGFLRDVNGDGVGGIPKSRLTLEVAGQDQSGNAKACFLTADATGKLSGSTSDTSSAEAGGGFLLFDVPVGINKSAYVGVAYSASAVNFPPRFVTVGAGEVGLVTLRSADEAPPVVDLVNFDVDVYPLFTQYGCNVCHREGGPAAYVLRLDEQPEAVHAALTAPSTTCGASAYKTCVNDPERSLLLTMPLLEDPPNHPNASFSDTSNPGYVTIKAWIEQGAVRQLAVTPPSNQYYTLAGVMDISQQRGCASCHGYDLAYDQNRPAGNLALDGCEAYYIDNGTYAANGIDYNEGTNPNYKRDCVYYHLTKILVDDDPYFSEQPDNNEDGSPGTRDDGRLVNLETPEHSMLLRNPYCGLSLCADGPYAETHPVKVFAEEDDPAYTALRSWIQKGALNDGDPSNLYYYE